MREIERSRDSETAGGRPRVGSGGWGTLEQPAQCNFHSPPAAEARRKQSNNTVENLERVVRGWTSQCLEARASRGGMCKSACHSTGLHDAPPDAILPSTLGRARREWKRVSERAAVFAVSLLLLLIFSSENAAPIDQYGHHSATCWSGIERPLPFARACEVLSLPWIHIHRSLTRAEDGHRGSPPSLRGTSPPRDAAASRRCFDAS